MNPHVTILGAGLSGALMSIFLARNARKVVLYERRPDLRKVDMDAGRSINLALAARGIEALKEAGVFGEVERLLIPMRGRMLHDLDGRQSFVPYGQRPHEVIYSVSRPGLNGVLLDHAQRVYGVSPKFLHAARSIDFEHDELTMLNEVTGDPHRLRMAPLIAADGAGSIVRRAMTGQLGVRVTEDLLEHGYKELTLPASPEGTHRVEKHALHIWPRGGFMLIALPNLDGSFTVTLFLPLQGEESFASLTEPGRVTQFFRRYFPDVCALLPALTDEFLLHPTGIMGTVRCERWSVEDRLLLIGDAAHAITPFHGQGMNCAFEDCRELVALLDTTTDWASTFRRFEVERRPHTDAIADMAIENYLEMRDTVRDPQFHLQKTLSLELERRFPQRFVPRYSMVMFHDEIPYAVALERGRIQNKILGQLTRNVGTLGAVDFQAAQRLIEERLPPISPQAPK
jgi:kynurenine 3-monooxygenase